MYLMILLERVFRSDQGNTLNLFYKQANPLKPNSDFKVFILLQKSAHSVSREPVFAVSITVPRMKITFFFVMGIIFLGQYQNYCHLSLGLPCNKKHISLNTCQLNT